MLQLDYVSKYLSGWFAHSFFIAVLKLFTVLQETADSDREFQSLMVRIAKLFCLSLVETLGLLILYL